MNNGCIHRIVIPFEDIYTSVFIVETDAGVIVFDSGTFPSDMDRYVFPLLEKMSALPEYIFVSHGHRDHAGGLARVKERYPNIRIVSGSAAVHEKFEDAILPEDGEILLDVLKVIAIPGHTADSMGLLDMRSNTLLTGDSLQLYGIYGSGNWGANIRYVRSHLDALKKLRGLAVEEIIASHDYHPCGHIAQGHEEVARYLDQCEQPLYEIAKLIHDYPTLDNAELAALYNATKGLPKLGTHVVEAVRREMV